MVVACMSKPTSDISVEVQDSCHFWQTIIHLDVLPGEKLAQIQEKAPRFEIKNPCCRGGDCAMIEGVILDDSAERDNADMYHD